VQWIDRRSIEHSYARYWVYPMHWIGNEEKCVTVVSRQPTESDLRAKPCNNEDDEHGLGGGDGLGH